MHVLWQDGLSGNGQQSIPICALGTTLNQHILPSLPVQSHAAHMLNEMRQGELQIAHPNRLDPAMMTTMREEKKMSIALAFMYTPVTRICKSDKQAMPGKA